MQYEIRKEGNIHIVNLCGNITIGEVDSFRDDIEGQILSKEITYLVLNFKDVDYIDSWGLSIIISFYKNVTMGDDGVLIVCEASDNVKKVFLIVKLDTIIKICDTETEAVQQIQQV